MLHIHDGGKKNTKKPSISYIGNSTNYPSGSSYNTSANCQKSVPQTFSRMLLEQRHPTL